MCFDILARTHKKSSFIVRQRKEKKEIIVFLGCVCLLVEECLSPTPFKFPQKHFCEWEKEEEEEEEEVA